MSVSELEKMVKVARDGHWEKEKVSVLLCKENKHGKVFFSSLDFNTQKEVALWYQQGINQIAHKISEELLQWILHLANEGNWNKEELATAVCSKSSDKKPPISMCSSGMQKQLAELNQSKTCEVIPWMGNNFHNWLYHEAVEGRWNQDLVFRVLKREEMAGATVVSAKMTSPSGQ